LEGCIIIFVHFLAELIPSRAASQVPTGIGVFCHRDKVSRAKCCSALLFLRICAAAGLVLALGYSPATLAQLQATDTSATPDLEPITPVPDPPAADPLKVALGERLFKDPRLSRGNTRACSSCHDLRTNGASRNAKDLASDGSLLSFNTTTVFNSTLSFRFGWEGEFRTLEAQAAASLQNPRIMDSRIEDVIGKLSRDSDVERKFEAAYGHGPDASSVLDAIAAFERSLVTPNSQFDRWLAGDRTALSAQQLDGYRLFKSLGCVSCHQGVNVGGNLFQQHGIFHPLARAEPEILRVPSLRNVATTAPYFHDGSAASLNEAVRKMATAQLDLALTDQEVDHIVVFLQSLTGIYHGRLVEEPK
jgi:cytochrome c peroxidase